ncbi:hypothetical protein SAMN04488060_2681, partial [Qipengyuania nanhaisediminis]
VWSGITSHREGQCKTLTSRALMAACGTNCSMRLCSSAWLTPASRSLPGWRTTTGRGRILPSTTTPRRRSPPNWISNGQLRYALRAPLRSPLLQPRSCATTRSGSNPSWGKAGGHVTTSGRLSVNHA